jgi:hypothetical protein
MVRIVVARLAALAGLLSTALASPHRIRQSTTPSVDLGYEIHTAEVNVRARF